MDKLSDRAVRISGKPYTFGVACLVIILWALSGPLMHFSDTWQLIINTTTTLITFLMVFLIQNAQNREQEQFKKWIKEDLNHTKETLNAIRDSRQER